MKLRLLSESVDLSSVGWVDPDFLVRNAEDAIAFIYLNGKLYYKAHAYHDEVFDLVPDDELYTPAQDGSAIKIIKGRVGTVDVSTTYDAVRARRAAGDLPSDEEFMHVCGIYEYNNNLDVEVLGACLQALADEGIIEDGCLISLPASNQIWPFDEEFENRELSLDEVERVKLLQQMHLARGQEKKDIMKKLGLGFEGRPKKDQYHFGGGDDPVKGQAGKWWAPYSESRR